MALKIKLSIVRLTRKNKEKFINMFIVHTCEHPVIGDSKGRFEHELTCHLNKRTIKLWEGGKTKEKDFGFLEWQIAGN